MTFSISLHILDHPLLSLNGWHYMWISGPLLHGSNKIMTYFSGCSSSSFFARLLWRVHLAADDKLWFSFIAHPAGQVVTNWNKTTKLPNCSFSQLKIFHSAFIHPDRCDQPIDLISDILDKSLWVGTATPSKIFQAFFYFFLVGCLLWMSCNLWSALVVSNICCNIPELIHLQVYVLCIGQCPLWYWKHDADIMVVQWGATTWGRSWHNTISLLVHSQFALMTSKHSAK